MILSKAGRLSLLAGLLCLLLMGFTGAANAVIRWDVFPSPTEVINSGRSEVLGSTTLVVQANQGATVTTGNILGGPTQIGILFNNKIMIDNSPTSGIKLFSTNTALSSALCVGSSCDPNTKFFITAQNIDVTNAGQFAGLITVNIPGGIVMTSGELIRVDGVRGRIDKSELANPGTDGFAQLQSINDPAGNQFFPETIRVAKSFIPMIVAVTSEQAILCLPSYGGSPDGSALTTHKIRVTENFNRAFVARDSNNTDSTGTGAYAPDSTDRLDSMQQILGSPSNGTQIKIQLTGIPASVTSVSWQPTVNSSVSGAGFQLISTTALAGTVAGAYPPAGTAAAVYEYVTSNQAGASDAFAEQFDFIPQLVLSTTNQQDVGQVMAAVTLWPAPPETNTGLYQPYTCNSRTNTTTCPAMPRFVTNYTTAALYETFGQCVCYLMFPFVSVTNYWDTGLAVANTSDDTNVFPSTVTGAPRQAGTVTFYLYDFRLGSITPATGVWEKDVEETIGSSVVHMVHRAPLGQNGPAFNGGNVPGTDQPIYYAGQSVITLASKLLAQGGQPAVLAADRSRADFQGYMIARANFQFCHGYAFVADKTFSQIAQGYVANVIPDPASYGNKRLAVTAGDTTVRVGESFNN